MNNQYSRQFENIERIKIISQALGTQLLKKVVFVGGAVVGLYATKKDNISFSRPTKDIDCVIKLSSKSDYNNISQQLRKKNFEDLIHLDAPICRWLYKDIFVDIMPDDSKILGFSNKWYAEGINNSINYKISDDITIKIFTTPYFIASKFEAVLSRGSKDLRESHDLEDIIYILSYRKEVFDEINNSDQKVKIYLSGIFKYLVNLPSIIEIITYSLPYGVDLDEILSIMKNISEIN